jgi:GntR family transcriptional regulator
VKISIDEGSAKHAYEQVADALRAEIQAGRIGPRVPSIMQLTEDTGLSRVTIIRALDVLEAEGLIFTRRGRGTFVTGQADQP